MWRQSEDFIGSAQKKCVNVNYNGEFEQGKVLYMEPDWSLHDFLSAASQRLNLESTASRVFSSDGVEIDDCMMIEDNDILFISNGEAFVYPVLEGNSSSSSSESIPAIIGGYKVGKVLGRGGFGEVRLGEHQLTNEAVALKFLRKAEILSMGAAERTTTEIQCLTALKHQNIIRLTQHVESPHHVVLIFELMEGGDLFNYLLQKQKEAGVTDLSPTSGQHTSLSVVTEEEARHVFAQVLSAIGYAHNQHICHRDLKLENILLKTKNLSVVKIADFGLSAFYRPGTMMKSSCGTLSFLAPEVFKGTSNAGPPLDVWSMGVILFALLCGRLPFEGTDLSGSKRPRDAVIRSRISKCQYKIDEGLSPEAKDLVRRMLRIDPIERASIPEIFSHSWMRVSSCLSFEMSRSMSHSPPHPSLLINTLEKSDSKSPIITPSNIVFSQLSNSRIPRTLSKSSLDEDTSSVAVTLTGPSSAETETEEYLATLDTEVMNQLERHNDASPPVPPDVETLSLQEKTEATFVLVPLRRHNSKDNKDPPLSHRERESSKTVVEKASTSLLTEPRSARPNTAHVSLSSKKQDDSVSIDAASPRRRLQEDSERPAAGVYSSPLANRKSSPYLGTLSERMKPEDVGISASFTNSSDDVYAGSPVRTRLLQAGSASLKPHRMSESLQEIPKSPSVQSSARRGEDDLTRQTSSRGGIASTSRSQRSDVSPVTTRKKLPTNSPGITGRKKPLVSDEKKFDFEDWK